MAIHGFVLVSDEERDEESGQPLYWSNDLGWVDRDSATVFPDINGSVPLGRCHWESA